MFVEVQVCVDRSGRVDGTRIEVTTPSAEAYARAALAAAATWRFTPFPARGKPVRVCAIETFSDSPELRARPRERPVRAEPRDSPQNVPPTALDAVRFAGQPAIAPMTEPRPRSRGPRARPPNGSA